MQDSLEKQLRWFCLLNWIHPNGSLCFEENVNRQKFQSKNKSPRLSSFSSIRSAVGCNEEIKTSYHSTTSRATTKSVIRFILSLFTHRSFILDENAPRRRSMNIDAFASPSKSMAAIRCQLLNYAFLILHQRRILQKNYRYYD